MLKSKKLSRDARLKEIAHVLAKGIIRMKDAGELLTSRSPVSSGNLQPRMAKPFQGTKSTRVC